jgi:hypothetical protein
MCAHTTHVQLHQIGNRALAASMVMWFSVQSCCLLTKCQVLFNDHSNFEMMYLQMQLRAEALKAIVLCL